HCHVPFRKLDAHGPRAEDVTLIGAGEHSVGGVRVARLLAAPDHIYVELRDDLLQGDGREAREVLRAPEALLLARVPDEEDRAFRSRPLREGLGHRDERGRPRSVVVSTVADFVVADGAAAW